MINAMQTVFTVRPLKANDNKNFKARQKKKCITVLTLYESTNIGPHETRFTELKLQAILTHFSHLSQSQ